MKLAIIALLAGAVALQAADTVPVASLSTVLSDIATNVGGDKVTVTSIVKPGIDPHEFEPSPGDVKAISQAKLVLAAGLGFESFLSKVKTAVGSGPTFVIVGESITPILTTEEEDHDHEGHDHEHSAPNADGKVPDPHWWHSIENVKIATRVIRDALIQIDRRIQRPTRQMPRRTSPSSMTSRSGPRSRSPNCRNPSASSSPPRRARVFRPRLQL